MKDWDITAEELYMNEVMEQELLAELAKEGALEEEEDMGNHEDAYLTYAPFFDYSNRYCDMDEI